MCTGAGPPVSSKLIKNKQGGLRPNNFSCGPGPSLEPDVLRDDKTNEEDAEAPTDSSPLHLSQPFSTSLRTCAMRIPTRKMQRLPQIAAPWRARASPYNWSYACAAVGVRTDAAPRKAAEAAPPWAVGAGAARGAETNALPIDESNR